MNIDSLRTRVSYKNNWNIIKTDLPSLCWTYERQGRIPIKRPWTKNNEWSMMVIERLPWPRHLLTLNRNILYTYGLSSLIYWIAQRVGLVLIAMASECVQVIVRCRPFNEREKQLKSQVIALFIYIQFTFDKLKNSFWIWKTKTVVTL